MKAACEKTKEAANLVMDMGVGRCRRYIVCYDQCSRTYTRVTRSAVGVEKREACVRRSRKAEV